MKSCRNYFLRFADLEDTKNKSDEFIEYYDSETKEFNSKYVKSEDVLDISVSNDLYSRFTEGEDVSYELNELREKRGEPIIDNLSELLISEMDRPNEILNAAKKELFEEKDIDNTTSIESDLGEL